MSDANQLPEWDCYEGDRLVATVRAADAETARMKVADAFDLAFSRLSVRAATSRPKSARTRTP